MPSATTRTDRETVTLRESLSQRDKVRPQVIALLCAVQLKNEAHELIICKNRNRHTDSESKLMATKGETRGGGVVNQKLVVTHTHTHTHTHHYT